MCGIAGLIGFKGDARENVRRMNERMLHRGPDDGGIYISDDGQVALGHRRLSIVDLSKNGAQPMVSQSGRSVIVYNGEIYNAQELRDMLNAAVETQAAPAKEATSADGRAIENDPITPSPRAISGTQAATAKEAIENDPITPSPRFIFRSTSDTEVLLECIERFGAAKTLKVAKGMFAFAYYDREAGTVTMARDRVGEKPLYYGTVAGAFAFASDIGCLRVVEGFNNPINTDILDMYFTEGYIPAPHSIYKDVYKLEPGTILTLDLKTMETETETYWSMMSAAFRGSRNQFKGTETEAADELERLLKASIKGQMVADVPLGAFLSAGIDSSTVVSLMQAQSDKKVRTFTIGMEDPAFNEAKYAKEIARHLGTEHTELYITEADAKAVIPKLSFMFGEPFADSSQIPTYLVSKMTRDHVTVSLSGDGGDELFCGYRSYDSVSRVWNKISKLPYGLRRPASALALLTNRSDAPEDVKRSKALYLGARTPYDLHRMEHETDPIAKRIALKRGKVPYKCSDLPKDFLGEVNHEAMLMDMMLYHPDDILVKVDRTAMAVSLESRVPMLDRDVVEFAWTLPIEYLKDEKVGKKVLRDVLYRYVPSEMMERPKKGFSIPIAKWLADPEIRDWAEELLNPDKIRQQGILDPAVVEKIWTDFTDRGIYRIQIWYILMFQQWMQDEYLK